MRELVTTLLDMVGLVLISAGVAGGLWQFIGPWSLCSAGVLILTGSWAATRGEET